MSDIIRQGIQAGRRWPAEQGAFTDRETGVAIRQLTDGRAHSHHLYFTNPGWYDDGARLLFGSDRSGSANLYSLELATGAITQLTDLHDPGRSAPWSVQNACVNPTRPEAYLWYGPRLIAVDLDTLAVRVIADVGAGFTGSMTNVTADGAAVCTSVSEDLSDRFEVDLGRGYVGFREYWEARPLCRVLRVPVDGGDPQVLHEEHSWIGHVNTSPTRPELLTFCHEGPWQLVDQRIWGLDAASGQVWKIRPTAAGERVGHEYWLADGERIGYHGSDAGGRPFYGFCRHDDSDHVEAPFPQGSTHFHSHGSDLIVGDGSRTYQYLLLWRRGPRDGVFEPARKLAFHRGSFQVQQTHVHPRFSLDGGQIVFTSDLTGYGNLYLLDVPDVDGLPTADV